MENNKKIINIIFPLSSFFIIKILIFINIIFLSKCECDLNSPIYKNETCQLVYCTENEFQNGICYINNEIIKTQWLNNIILFNDRMYRYCNFAKNSKGDMIAELSTEEENGIRLFYGLKKNGDFFFKSTESDVATKIIKIEDGNKKPIRYESENIFISLNNENDNNEYLISISLYYGYTELFDFETNQQSFVKTEDFTGYNIYSTINQLIEIKNNITNVSKYIHIFVGQEKTNVNYRKFYIVLNEYTFSKNNISYEDGYSISNHKRIDNAFSSRSISGYKTDLDLIVLFYINNHKFKINIYDLELNEKKNKDISSTGTIDGNRGIFFKCIHLKNNLGAFIYYKNENDYGPELKIEDIEKSTTNYNIREKINLSLIFTEYRFNSEPILNDLVKINDYRFSFITSSYDKSQLFILLFDFYNNDKNLKIRIYRIYLLDLYNLRIYREISSILYNNYLTISLSACDSLPCDYSSGSNSDYFSFLVIFSYINGTDTFIDFSPFLKANKIENKDDNDFVIKLLENAQIDNNIFGYQLLNKIKLITFPNELIFYNIRQDGGKTSLKENDVLLIGQEIEEKLSLTKTNDAIYSLEYQFIVKEPNYEIFNKYPIKIFDYPDNPVDDQNNTFVENEFYSRINIVKFKLCNEMCETCEYLGTSNDPKCTIYKQINETTNSDNFNTLSDETEKEENIPKTEEINRETDIKISENITEDINKNEDCENNTKYYIDKNSNEKICLQKGDNCPLKYPFFNKTTNQCTEIVSYQELLNINFTSYTAEEEKEIIYNLFKNEIIENYSGNDNLIVTSQDSNVFQLTNSLNELNMKNGISSNNYNLSMIDLGECGIKLKKKNNIDENTPLIIFKLEQSNEVASKRNLQYEVYDPITKTKMDLSICDDEKINIYIPVSLSEDVEELHNDLLSHGYDLFNPNDIFYNDFCTPYTSINGTDVILSDRRNYYYNDTETSCQEGCEYSGYSTETKHLKCECVANNKEINTNNEDTKFDEKIIVTSFIDVIKYSNYQVLKCYKIVFNYKYLKFNYGSYIFIGYYIFYALFNFLFYVEGFRNIKKFAAKILYNNDSKNNFDLDKNKNKNRNIKKKSNKSVNIYRPDINTPPKKTKVTHGDFSKSEKSICLEHNPSNFSKEIKILKRNKTKVAKESKFFNKRKTLDFTSDKLKSKRKSVSYNKIVNIKFHKQNEKNINNIINNGNKNEYTEKKEKKNIFSYFKGNNFSDFELNELRYLQAIKYDKRSYFRYYWSLIRREHLIVFTFFSYNDYNILSIKLSKFIFALATDFALNVVFFFDDTMSKIYLDYGKYNFIAQIPQAIYSTIVSEVLDVLLRYLCLTEKDMYRLKKLEQQKKKKYINKDIFKILRCIKIKLFAYFVITHILLFFYWYFVSAFCAVYKNTQKFLFKDSFISLLLSLLYPFGLYIFPTSLRILSLRDSKKRLEIIYKVSDIIPLI